MTVATRLFAVLLIWLLAAGPLRAQEELLPPPVLDSFYAGLEPKSAREFLTVLEFDEYTRLLTELKCNVALMMVLDRFAVAHPDWPSPILDNRHVQSWYRDLGETYYPEIFFCLNVQQIRDAQAQISQENIVAERFVGSLFDSNLPDPVRQRNSSMFSLLEQADKNYPPAYLELARLSREGEIVRFSAVYQYYLLLRARELGLQSDELDKLLSAARWRLTPFEIVSLESVDYRKQLEEGEPIYVQ